MRAWYFGGWMSTAWRNRASLAAACFRKSAMRARREQIELQQIAQGLDVPGIQGQRGFDLLAKSAGQEQLLDGSGMLRSDT